MFKFELTMKKLLFALPLLLLFSCSKDNSNPNSKYLISVTCTDCTISVSDYGMNIQEDIKGSMDIPIGYVPGTLVFSIWSKIPNDNAYVAFKGGTEKYAALTVFSGVLKYQNGGYDLVEKQLPPKR